MHSIDFLLLILLPYKFQMNLIDQSKYGKKNMLFCYLYMQKKKKGKRKIDDLTLSQNEQ